MNIIGIDCATDPQRVGIALARHEAGRCAVAAVELGTSHDVLVERIGGWLLSDRSAGLLALDAPLGWPAPLGPALATHAAGQPVDEPPDRLFRTETDRFVRSRIGKRPLEVGADRIARTAHAALGLLADAREQTGAPIPLAWTPRLERFAAIEVYPAATLTAHGLRASGYKSPGDEARRAEILRGLGERLEIPSDLRELPTSNADALDAIVCVLAASDFAKGRAAAPSDPEQARREGWIWVSAAERDPWLGAAPCVLV